MFDLEKFYEREWYHSNGPVNFSLKPNGEYMHDIMSGANPVLSVFPFALIDHFVEVYL